MAAAYTYTFLRVSKTDDIFTSAQKYKQLRLSALRTSPTSFSSTFDIESAFTDEHWINRLLENDKETFACVATPVDPEKPSEWVGQVTIRGPMPLDDVTLPEASGQPALKSDDEEERWQMLSLFTLDEHRGKGLGKYLCQAALDYLRDYRSQPANVRVRLMIKPDNRGAVRLYHQLGFYEAGRGTLAEALIANGDRELLPKDVSGEKYSSRTSWIMMLEIQRAI